jgi:hypothetical protein
MDQVAAQVNLQFPGYFLLFVLLLWCFGAFLNHGFPVARVSRQFSFFLLRMSVPRPTARLVWHRARNLSSRSGLPSR